MRRNPATTKSARLAKLVSAALISAALLAIVGCQGVSSGGSGQQSGSLVLGSASLDFGSVTPGVTKALTLTATNSGNKSITVSSASISTKHFALASPVFPLSLAVGQSANLSITFTPNAATDFTAMLTVSSDATDASATVSLSGAGTGPLQLNPTSEAFGNVNVGSNQSQLITLTNSDSSSVSISQIAISGTGFSLSGITTPLSLNPSNSTTFTVMFAPKASGAVSGTVTITSDASNPALTMNLSGTGVSSSPGQLSVSPATLGLGSVMVGSSVSATGTVSASGASVTISGASTNNSVFTIGGFSLPHTLAAGQSANYTITFSPLVSGAANATLSFTSDAQTTTTTEALTGTGTPAPTHSVALSWNASTSPNISGYNIYRALYTTSCGSFGTINTLLNTTTTYTDSSVTNGSSYCYATTAVNTSNTESGYSNIVSNIQIPAQ